MHGAAHGDELFYLFQSDIIQNKHQARFSTGKRFFEHGSTLDQLCQNWARRVENHFVKTTLSTPDRDSNFDLPIIGILVYYENNALDHAASEADNVKVRVLFNADDAVLMAKNENDLQNALNRLNVVTDQLDLRINVSKTKVVVFDMDGDPSRDLDVKWSPYTKLDHFFMNIDTKLSLQKDLNKDRMAFWEQLYKEVST
ncbi:unnamed protein product [Timema podura]|uniref:Reverse transcriptase domain-containing protein n=1 Tax=Timema podura TaxID=61482 RepID=A0ABN7NIJ5_TIMPD|nr:unnamed protein product [Timema podura]